MHQSFFSYPISRPYPFRWFTPVTTVGGIILAVLFSLVNLASSGFYLKTIYTSDPNGTVSAPTEWYLKAPFNWENSMQVQCQPRVLSVGDRFYTSNLGLQYEITSIKRSEGDASKLNNVPSIPYMNNTLNDCYLTDSTLHLQKGDSNPNPTWWLSYITSSVTSRATCAIVSEQGTIQITLDVIYGGESSKTYPYVIDDNYTTHATTWWGSRLLNVYFAGILAVISQIKLEDDIYLTQGAIVYSRDLTKDDIRSSDLFQIEHWFLTSDGDVKNNNSFDTFLLDSKSEGIHHTKLLHSLVSVDLGNCEAPNILLDDEGLRYAVLDPKNPNRNPPDGVLYQTLVRDPARYAMIPGPGTVDLASLNETYDKFTPQTGPLKCKNATIVSEYPCSIPQMKSSGTMLVAVLLANLVFLQAAWKLLNLISESILARKGSEIYHCQGCAKGPIYEALELGERGKGGERVRTEPADPNDDSARLIPSP